MDNENERIKAIRRRLEKAAPGPWEAWIEGIDHTSGDSFIRTDAENLVECGEIYLTGASNDDLEFIANSRQDIEFLLSILNADNI